MTAKKLTALTTAVLIGIGALVGGMSQAAQDAAKDLYSQVELFSYALTTIQSEYVDPLTPKDLIYGALRGMLSSLDPHSSFMDPDEYNELKTETRGQFGGLGIEISIRDGLLTIIAPIEDTPAWRAGLKAGDRIVKIEDKITKDMTLDEAVKLLRGEPGTQVTITVLREGEFKLLDFTITREIIQIQDIKDPMLLADHIAYVRIAEFREKTHEDFKKEIDRLKKEGADSLILDLRNNPGGLLNVAIAITEEFLPPGELIVSTKGRRPSQTMETYSKNVPGKFLGMPLVVLINEGSASGSEILAGAIQDNRRGLLLGTKSFGKGSVQSVIPLPDGSGLRLTTAKYYTPSGRSIHGTGIEPDIVVPFKPVKEDDSTDDNPAKKVKEVFEKIEQQESENPEALEEQQKREKRKQALLKDNQVQAAIRVIKGIKVYEKVLEHLKQSENASDKKQEGSGEGQPAGQQAAPTAS